MRRRVIRGSGYVVDTLEAALRVFATTDTFADGPFAAAGEASLAGVAPLED